MRPPPRLGGTGGLSTGSGHKRNGVPVSALIYSASKVECGRLLGYIRRRVIPVVVVVFAQLNFHACGFVLMGQKQQQYYYY